MNMGWRQKWSAEGDLCFSSDLYSLCQSFQLQDKTVETFVRYAGVHMCIQMCPECPWSRLILGQLGLSQI